MCLPNVEIEMQSKEYELLLKYNVEKMDNKT